MKHTSVAILAMGLLAACAGVGAPGAARSQTPQQSLATTGQRMSQLQSLKFDLAGTIALTLPQQLVDQLRARDGSPGGFLSTAMTVNLKVSGAARRPDQLQATVTAKIGGVTINTEARAVGGTLYYKDPITAEWRVVTRDATGAHEKGVGKLSYQLVLDTAKSVTEVSDSTTLNGVAVDHYRVVPDLIKLFAQLAAQLESRDPPAAAVVEQTLAGVNLTADVWTGVDDHLIHRLSYDADATVDLHQLATASLRASQQAPTLPRGSVVHLTAHVVIDLHDFNAQVNVQAPPVAS